MALLKSATANGRTRERRRDLWLRHRMRWHRCARVRIVVAEVLLVVGLMLAPALAACDFTVWLSCRDLDTSACVALLSRMLASSAGAESGTGSVAVDTPQPAPRAASR